MTALTLLLYIDYYVINTLSWYIICSLTSLPHDLCDCE